MSETPHIKNIFSAEEEDCLSLEQMIAYRDGKLPPGEKHYAERHLLNCELCEMAYEGVAEEGHAVVEAGAAAIAEAAWERVGEQEKKRRRGAWVWISAAASIVLIMTVGLIFFRGPSDETMERVAQEYYNQPAPPPLAADNPDDSAALAMNKNSEEVPVEESADSKEGDLTAEIEELRDARELKDDLNERFTLAEPDEGPTGSSFGEVAKEREQEYNSGTSQNLLNAPSPKTPIPVAPSSTHPTPGKEALKSIQQPVTTEKNQQFMQDLVTVTDNESMEDFDAFDDDQGLEEESLEEVDAMEIISAPTPKQENQITVPTKAMTRSVSKDIAAGSGVQKGKSNTSDRSVSRSKKANESPSNNRDANVAMEEAEEMVNPIDGSSSGGEDKVSSGSTVSGAITETISDPYADGMESYRAGLYTESATLLRKASAATPANLQAHYYAAASFMNINQPQAAIYHLDRILAQPGNSLFADAEWYKALAYLKLKDHKNAKSLLEKIVRNGGKHAPDASKALKDL